MNLIVKCYQKNYILQKCIKSDRKEISRYSQQNKKKNKQTKKKARIDLN